MQIGVVGTLMINGIFSLSCRWPKRFYDGRNFPLPTSFVRKKYHLLLAKQQQMSWKTQKKGAKKQIVRIPVEGNKGNRIAGDIGWHYKRRR